MSGKLKMFYILVASDDFFMSQSPALLKQVCLITPTCLSSYIIPSWYNPTVKHFQ